ncbi:MAG: signal peptidase I [Roseburia sp.]|nr:signal peptidase I [Roseburia sp.]
MQQLKRMYDFCYWLLVLTWLVFLVCFRLTFVLGTSMTPTLNSGELHVFSRFAEPEVGDIVLLRAPSGDCNYVKRLIAVPGDTVEHCSAPLLLDADQYYVCGDNRGASYDSRSFGPIPGNSILGVLVF